MDGYGGKILRINVSTGETNVEKVTEEMIKKYLGGDGFAVKLLYETVPKGTEPYAPENAVIITPGVLTGAPLPTSGKVLFCTKSPLTATISESVMGGSIGAELKYAGYDAVVITGKAEKPSYLFINDDDVKVVTCEELWRKNTREADEILKKKLGADVKVASIGVAGENLVRYAGIDSEERQSGRGGLGAVLGSKRIKAIAVRGTKGLDIHDPVKAMDLVKKWQKVMVTSGAFKDDTKYGTGEFLEWMNAERGAFPTRNFQEGVFNEREKINPYYWAPKYSKKNKGCYTCIKPCGKLFTIKEGPYAGTKVDGIEYETLYSLGSACGNADIEAVARANELCDLYGLDTISTGVTIGFVMELYERGILNEVEIGFKLPFGKSEAVPQLVEMIAHRRRIGDLMAEGVKRMAEKIGKGAERYAVHVKGMEPPAYDVRGIKGMALAFMTSPRGACHLKSGAYALELTGKFWKFSGVDRFSAENKGYEIKEMEDFMTVYDSLGVCKFSRGFFLIQEFPEILETMTGVKFTEGELLEIGERANNIKRLFNAREGITRKDCLLPPRITEDPIPEGVSKGSYVTVEEMNAMLDDYFRARGWNNEGIPTKEKLEDLEIEDMA